MIHSVNFTGNLTVHYTCIDNLNSAHIHMYVCVIMCIFMMKNYMLKFTKCSIYNTGNVYVGRL